jgi:ATP-dependent Lhr-like helicase
MFHPLVTQWFAQRFGAATAVQELAWPHIAAGKDVLITAPTGSGKTLAAFLSCLDGLVRESEREGGLPDETRIVYVSPLKALSNDVQRNLESPLRELRALAGSGAAAIRTAVRTGDTSMTERRQIVKRPPHVLVTTPESLYILLTSDSGRRGLRSARVLIVDEIHTMAADKRGAHLTLSIERLEALTAGRLQRIGLSATVNPPEVAARILVGAERPAPVLVDASLRRDLNLAIELPRDELGAACTHEQWGEIYDRVADLARAHRSTLVFVNTRRLVERVAHNLAARLGEPCVGAHHGSLSRERRFATEQRLKAGALQVVVATASLELGIDVGAVDLVCLIGSPRTIATGMQRIGRSGHAVGGTPKGRFFPQTRDQLLECAALVRAARVGKLDAISARKGPLDILAQQIVATCACDEWDEDALFALFRRAAPYHDLERKDFDAVVDMLAEGIATSRGRSGALIHRDAVHRRLRARRGARLTALTSGGAIPDTALYDVILEPEGTFIGTLDEDFAIESMAGDIILLGNTSWRIRRVENGRVRVEDAAGAPPSVPFWFGEGPARSRELSEEVGRLREHVVAMVGPHEVDEVTRASRRKDAIDDLVATCAVDPAGAALLADYVSAGEAMLGSVPTQTRVVAERFFDESGGTQIVIHAPFGGRINRAWGMALRKRFCRSFDFELQAAATDDGVLLSLGPQHSFPLETILDMLRPEHVRELLVQASLQAPVFETRWRWNATRALALRRHQGGKRVPPNLQRMRAQDLLAAVFPGQVACQDNHGGGAILVPDHPLVAEAVHDCLSEAMDAAGLERVLADLRDGRITRVVRETPEPSVFAHEILNANPYAFLDDAPLEERRSRAVAVRRGLPAALADGLGAIDPDALAAVVEAARPAPQGADEVHDLLLDLGVLPVSQARALEVESDLARLASERRAGRLCVDPPSASARATATPHHEGDGAAWVAAERLSLARAVWPGMPLDAPLTEPAARRTPTWEGRDGAIAEIVRGHMTFSPPTTAAALGARLAIPATDVDAALIAVENSGQIMRGRFSRGLPEGDTEWLDRRLLARASRLTVEGLRRAIEPASAAQYLHFLSTWQHVARKCRLFGREGLLEVIGQLQGFEAAAGAWEREIFPARVSGYDPSWLDELCLNGEVVWGRLAPRAEGGAPTRAAPIGLVRRRDLGWLLAAERQTPSSPKTPAPPQEPPLSPKAAEVLAFLREAGASFVEDIAAATRSLRAEVEDALWILVAAGRVTADGFCALRALMPSMGARLPAPDRPRFRWYGRAPDRPGTRAGAGRWALLRAFATVTEDERMVALARQYIRRYGVVFRDVLARESQAPPWRDLVRVYRVLEMRGELRGGRLVAGFVGEQFAAPEAVDALRALRKQPPTGETLSLSACDPLNLVGILTPGPRVAAQLTGRVALRDGLPVTMTKDLHDAQELSAG